MLVNSLYSKQLPYLPDSKFQKFLALQKMLRELAQKTAEKFPSLSSIDEDDLFSLAQLETIWAVAQHKDGSGSLDHYVTVRVKRRFTDELRRTLARPRNRRQSHLQVAKEKRRRSKWKHVALDRISINHPLHLDAPMPNSDKGTRREQSIAETVDDPRVILPLVEICDRELREELERCLSSLREQSRVVLILYYWEKLKQREIAKRFGLTESRICQVLKEGIARLRQKLESCRSAETV